MERVDTDLTVHDEKPGKDSGGKALKKVMVFTPSPF